MPANLAKYPKGWKEFSLTIRRNRAGSRCECVGECGLHPPRDGKPRRCVERDREPARWANGKVVLTVAHLCQCEPLCANGAHVKAMCNRCHLRTDVEQHQRNARKTRAAKRARSNHDLFPETLRS